MRSLEGARRAVLRWLMGSAPVEPRSDDSALGEIFAHPDFTGAPPAQRHAVLAASARFRRADEEEHPFDLYFGRIFGADLAPRLRGAAALDLGCFTGGRSTAWIERYGLGRLTGVDVEPVVVAGARRFARSEGPDAAADFACAVGEALPFAADCFDAILSFDVFEHVQDIERVLAECGRVLKPGGILLAVFPPYWHPTEHHLGLVTRMPCLHWLFPGRELVKVYDDIVAARGPAAGWYRRRSPELAPWERGHTLNGITVGRFEVLVARSGLIPVERLVLPLFQVGRAVQRHPALRAMGAIAGLAARLPGLREIATHRVVAVLEKPPTLTASRAGPILGEPESAAASMSPDARPRLFMIGPVPPPYGGVGAIFQGFLDSEIGERFEVTVVDTSKKDAREIVSDPRIHLRDGVYLIRSLVELGVKLIRRRPQLAFLTPVADHSLLREALFVRMARLAGARVVCQFHARYEGELFVSGRRARGFLGPLLAPADRVLLLSNGLRSHFAADLPPSKTGVLPNFVDVARYAELPVPRVERPDLAVFFLGRLSEQKGIWDLLEAVAPVARAVPGVRFRLGGVAEFPEVDEAIARFLRERGLGERVELLGTVTGEAKVDAFGGADVFCLPSHLDNQPVAVLEAMAAGLPVVATRVGTLPEVVADGERGILVEPRDRAALAAALVRLLGDRELRARMGAAGRAHVAARFDRGVLVARLIEELEAVLGAGS